MVGFRYAFVRAQDKCTICGFPLVTRFFYVFPCSHKFHADCLVTEVRILTHHYGHSSRCSRVMLLEIIMIIGGAVGLWPPEIVMAIEAGASVWARSQSRGAVGQSGAMAFRNHYGPKSREAVEPWPHEIIIVIGAVGPWPTVIIMAIGAVRPWPRIFLAPDKNS